MSKLGTLVAHLVIHRKKRLTSFPSPAGMYHVTNQTPPGQELFSYDVIIPAQGEFGSDIPAGDGKIASLFYSVCGSVRKMWMSVWVRVAVVREMGGSV
jgi:hypothetical protein